MCGSIGIALSATLLSRGESIYRAMLTQHVTIGRNITSDMMRMLSASFYARGFDQVSADNRALKIIDSIVRRQATMLSYNHVYILVAALFLFAIPLALLIKDERLKNF
jgi:DHA2 family multidrug resistance protein